MWFVAKVHSLSLQGWQFIGTKTGTCSHSVCRKHISPFYFISQIFCIYVCECRHTDTHTHKHQNWSHTLASVKLNHDLVPSIHTQALREIPNTKQMHPTDITHLISFFPRTLMSSQHSLISAVVALFWAIASSSISICPHQQCSYNIGGHQRL